MTKKKRRKGLEPPNNRSAGGRLLLAAIKHTNLSRLATGALAKKTQTSAETYKFSENDFKLLKVFFVYKKKF